jgi:hypothetical protein
MNHLHTSDRKNVNVLGEDDLAKVVGGNGRYWRHYNGGGNKQGGGSHKQGGNKQGSGMQQRRFGGGGGDVTINIIDQRTIIINNFND